MRYSNCRTLKRKVDLLPKRQSKLVGSNYNYSIRRIKSLSVNRENKMNKYEILLCIQETKRLIIRLEKLQRLPFANKSRHSFPELLEMNKSNLARLEEKLLLTETN